MRLTEAAARLRAAGIENEIYEARLLFSHFGGLSPSMLYGRDAEAEDARIEPYLLRRERHEPMAYILGEQGFYRESYLVSPETLIPREDTEILVDDAVRRLPKGARFADPCTGSGCIALSVLNNTEGTTAVAVDLSEGALKVARKNAERLGLSDRARFAQADVLSDALSEALSSDAPFDAILCNPPYIPREVYEMLAPEIFFEPESAFVGEEEGMIFYRVLISALRPMLKAGGFLSFEIGYDQAERMRALAQESGYDAEILKDLSGNSRVALLFPK